jgi:hypothetical protein
VGTISMNRKQRRAALSRIAGDPLLLRMLQAMPVC